MRRLSFYCLALLANLASAVYLNSDTVLSLTLSSKGPTRISLKGERIKGVVVYPNTLQDRVMTHELGHVFVAPSTEDFFLTIIGARGTTQDVDVTFSSTASRRVVLEAPPKIEEPLDNLALTRLLLDFHSKKPEEVAKNTSVEFFEKLEIPLAPQVTFKTTGAYGVSNQIIYKGVVENTSDAAFILNPDQFPFAHLICLASEAVMPQKSVCVYFIKKGK